MVQSRKDIDFLTEFLHNVENVTFSTIYSKLPKAKGKQGEQGK